MAKNKAESDKPDVGEVFETKKSPPPTEKERAAIEHALNFVHPDIIEADDLDKPNDEEPENSI